MDSSHGVLPSSGAAASAAALAASASSSRPSANSAQASVSLTAGFWLARRPLAGAQREHEPELFLAEHLPVRFDQRSRDVDQRGNRGGIAAPVDGGGLGDGPVAPREQRALPGGELGLDELQPAPVRMGRALGAPFLFGARERVRAQRGEHLAVLGQAFEQGAGLEDPGAAALDVLRSRGPELVGALHEVLQHLGVREAHHLGRLPASGGRRRERGTGPGTPPARGPRLAFTYPCARLRPDCARAAPKPCAAPSCGEPA
jgi:hypothetical protein